MNKVILFIVEGITDMISLEAVMETFFSDKKISFKITEGDITTKSEITSQNIRRNLGNLIRKYMTKYGLEPKDILKIVHIIDTDGMYIDERYIKEEEREDFFYSEQEIKARSIENVLKRNKQKQEVISMLLNTQKVVRSIPYEIYYFSIELEHVLHNKLNPTSEEKLALANEIEEVFQEDPNKFKEIINNHKVEGSYTETWEYLKKENNSLKRKTNIHLILNEI